MSLLPNTHFGTELYPEKVARRLRAANITAWCAAAVCLFFTIVRLLDPIPGRWKIAAVNATACLAFASLPLLHRFGSLAAPLAFALVAYAYIFWVTSVLGTGGGSYLYYLTAAALGIFEVKGKGAMQTWFLVGRKQT